MNSALRSSAAHVLVESLDSPELSERDHHHIVRVLRLRDGEVVSATDGSGGWRLCVVAGGALRATTAIAVAPVARVVSIAMALPKGDRAEWAVQKLTEIGATDIAFLHTERSVTRWAPERAERQMAKLAVVAREAVMQSRRCTMPRLAGPFSVAQFHESLGANAAARAAMAEPGGDALAAGVSTVMVGPEGGWSPAELDCPLPRVALGAHVLRIETAAIVAATLLSTG